MRVMVWVSCGNIVKKNDVVYTGQNRDLYFVGGSLSTCNLFSVTELIPAVCALPLWVAFLAACHGENDLKLLLAARTVVNGASWSGTSLIHGLLSLNEKSEALAPIPAALRASQNASKLCCVCLCPACSIS